MTGIGQVAFPEQAAGSLIVQEGKAIGSRLIGQSFTEPEVLLEPPVGDQALSYNASASTGSNQGPLNPAIDRTPSRHASRL